MRRPVGEDSRVRFLLAALSSRSRWCCSLSRCSRWAISSRLALAASCLACSETSRTTF